MNLSLKKQYSDKWYYWESNLSIPKSSSPIYTIFHNSTRQIYQARGSEFKPFCTVVNTKIKKKLECGAIKATNLAGSFISQNN